MSFSPDFGFSNYLLIWAETLVQHKMDDADASVGMLEVEVGSADGPQEGEMGMCLIKLESK